MPSAWAPRLGAGTRRRAGVAVPAALAAAVVEWELERELGVRAGGGGDTGARGAERTVPLFETKNNAPRWRAARPLSRWRWAAP
jgi:hypothetical protein